MCYKMELWKLARRNWPTVRYQRDNFLNTSRIPPTHLQDKCLIVRLPLIPRNESKTPSITCWFTLKSALCDVIKVHSRFAETSCNLAKTHQDWFSSRHGRVFTVFQTTRLTFCPRPPTSAAGKAGKIPAGTNVITHQEFS